MVDIALVDKVPEEILLALLALINNIQLSMDQQSICDSYIKQAIINGTPLDEIRSEIEEQLLETLSEGGDDWFEVKKIDKCLEIIDKYRKESEGKE